MEGNGGYYGGFQTRKPGWQREGWLNESDLFQNMRLSLTKFTQVMCKPLMMEVDNRCLQASVASVLCGCCSHQDDDEMSFHLLTSWLAKLRGSSGWQVMDHLNRSSSLSKSIFWKEVLNASINLTLWRQWNVIFLSPAFGFVCCNLYFCFQFYPEKRISWSLKKLFWKEKNLSQ